MLNVNSASADFVTIRHVFLIGRGSVGGGGSLANDCVAIYGSTDFTLSYYRTDQCGRCPFFISVDNFLAEYGYTGLFYGDAETHSELASVWQHTGSVSMTNITFRYSVFTYATSTGGLIFEASDVRVYGNVFWQDPGLPQSDFPNGLVGSWTVSSMLNSHIYNNTFINMVDAAFNEAMLAPKGTFTGTQARDNLFYNTGPAGSVPTMTHNHFIGVSTSGTNTSTSVGNPFVSLAGLDFRLTAGTTAGFTLSAPYATDLYGLSRGGDGTWDRGAAEFAPAASSPPTVTITAPTSGTTYSTTATPLTTLGGSAADDVGVTSVTWACPTCTPTSGTATCASCGAAATAVTWSVASVGLASGANVLTLTANDGDTQTGTDTLTVTYTPLTAAPTVLHRLR